MYDRKRLLNKYGEEKVRQAEKKLKGLTWMGNKEEMIESIINEDKHYRF